MQTTTHSHETDSLAALHEKIDRLSQHVEELTRRQRSLEELRQDLAPIVNDGYRVLVDELAALDGRFSLELLGRLVRQLMSSLETLTTGIERLNSLNDFLTDVRPLGRDALSATIARLDELERRGALAFLRALNEVGERVLGAFGPQDVHDLGEHIVDILTTTRNLTQRDVLKRVNETVSALRDEPGPAPRGLFGLMRAMREPEVRQGLGVMLHLLRRVAAEGDIHAEALPQTVHDPGNGA